MPDAAPLSTDRAPATAPYETMRLIRTFEETALSLAQDGLVPGFTHSCIGQEAVAAGVCGALHVDDRVASNHRGHGHLLAKGADPARMLAEMLGKQAGYQRGMGGELHIMDAAIGIIGANGIVGAGIPIGTGAALADQLAGNERVTAVFFGEGACAEGVFAEALNMAAVWSLPVVFVCENNLYGEFTRSADVLAGRVHDRARGYGVPGVLVDGQDVIAVGDAAKTAVMRARSGMGPTLIEAETYRWGGHFYGEEALLGSHRYRERDEVRRWMRERDPLVLERARLGTTVSDDRLAAIDERIAAELAAARAFAVDAALPPPDQALEFVFAEPISGPTWLGV